VQRAARSSAAAGGAGLSGLVLGAHPAYKFLIPAPAGAQIISIRAPAGRRRTVWLFTLQKGYRYMRCGSSLAAARRIERTVWRGTRSAEYWCRETRRCFVSGNAYGVCACAVQTRWQRLVASGTPCGGRGAAGYP
jgi:hypothetical protein